MTPGPSPTAGYVLDTWAVMAYFEDEPAAMAVEALLTSASDDGLPLLMTVVNVAEVWYTMARQISSEAADQGLDELRDLGVKFVPANLDLALQAAHLKSRYKMSLADCFAAALGQLRRSPVVTGDLEFRPVADQVEIRWLAS